jgi:hypothetical protein
MSNAMTPAQEAAAMWGSAENTAYSTRSRLVYALKALEFYGGLAERVEALAERDWHWTEGKALLTQLRATLGDQP